MASSRWASVALDTGARNIASTGCCETVDGIYVRIGEARPLGLDPIISDIAFRTVAEEINMPKETHVTAPTRFVEANGIRCAYRRFGSERGTALVFLQHFRGRLDN